MVGEEMFLSVLLQEKYPNLQELYPLFLLNKYVKNLRY